MQRYLGNTAWKLRMGKRRGQSEDETQENKEGNYSLVEKTSTSRAILKSYFSKLFPISAKCIPPTLNTIEM